MIEPDSPRLSSRAKCRGNQLTLSGETCRSQDAFHYDLPVTNSRPLEINGGALRCSCLCCCPSDKRPRRLCNPTLGFRRVPPTFESRHVISVASLRSTFRVVRRGFFMSGTREYRAFVRLTYSKTKSISKSLLMRAYSVAIIDDSVSDCIRTTCARRFHRARVQRASRSFPRICCTIAVSAKLHGCEGRVLLYRMRIQESKQASAISSWAISIGFTSATRTLCPATLLAPRLCIGDPAAASILRRRIAAQRGLVRPHRDTIMSHLSDVVYSRGSGDTRSARPDGKVSFREATIGEWNPPVPAPSPSPSRSRFGW